MKPVKHMHTAAALLVVTVIATGCGKGREEAPANTAPAALPPALTAVFAEAASEMAPAPIPELRRTAKPGDAVVFNAKVMGTKQPFVDKRAVFVVGDEGTLTSCDVLHGDGCQTPWDNCCDDADALRTGTATIQVVGDAGEVLRHGLRGVAGLKELSLLRIEGVVAPQATESAFIVNASSIQLR